MQDWDDHVIAMLDRCPSEKCFISHYPPAHNDTNLQMVPVMCRSHFDEGSQMPSFEAQSFQFEVRMFKPSHASATLTRPDFTRCIAGSRMASVVLKL